MSVNGKTKSAATGRLTVRAACAQRYPLDGADAQALEYALTMTEQERDEARAEIERLRGEREQLGYDVARYRSEREEQRCRAVRAERALATEREAHGNTRVLLFASEELGAAVREKLATERAKAERALVAAEARLVRHRHLIDVVFSECFWCPECKGITAADEDECCATCGTDCEVMPTHKVIAALESP